MRWSFKSLFGMSIAGAVSLAAISDAEAGHSHYTNGVEGIRAGSVPPEGFYVRQYHAFYTADALVDDKGNRHGMDVDVFAFVNRFIYSTDWEILGGYYFADFIVPLQYTSIEGPMTGGRNQSRFAVGDLLSHPFGVRWHGDQWDALFAVAMYIPVGSYKSNNAAVPGKGYWTVMPTAGFTYYFDQEKTWSAGILARYEHHFTDQRHTGMDPGDDFHFEWGIGKKLTSDFEIGMAGYCQWQLDDDKYKDGSRGESERAYAIGPELVYTIKPWKTEVSLRSLWEFENRNGTQGNITVLRFTTAF